MVVGFRNYNRYCKNHFRITGVKYIIIQSVAIFYTLFNFVIGFMGLITTSKLQDGHK